jgi:predicted amidohydrolase
VGPAFCGCSAVFDPFGIMLSGAGEAETLLEAVVDTERIHEVRCKLPSLSQRRRDLLF